MTRTEFATVDGVACDVLDDLGRLVITPHALTIDGQRNIPADMQPGESLEAFLTRHVPGITSGAWAVSLGGRSVPQHMWSRTYPKHGNLIACRCVVQKSVLSLLAVAVLAYFTLGAGVGVGGGWIANTFGAGLAASQAIGAGLFMAGSMLINKVLAPKVPKPADNGPGRTVYSLSGQRNGIRAYEPLPVLWGEMRVTPDLASQPYTWFEGDDQYLSTILLGGVNVHSVADLAIGDTPIASYNDVAVYYNGFAGMPSQGVPLYSNADTIAGGELEDSAAWVTRTSSSGAINLQLDLEYQLFRQGDRGLEGASVTVEAQYRPVGAGGWVDFFAAKTLSNGDTSMRRGTYTLGVPLGQYEVRMRRTDGPNPERVTRHIQWAALRTVQPDATDYSAWGRIGIKIKATGQLSGSLDTLRATYTARPLPVWSGTAWVTATTRANGLSNPGAILLQTMRGVYANGILQFGFGMQDEQIDIEGLKAFMLHCTARGYTYDKWITSSVSLGAFCEEVALAGMGQFVWTDGGRPTVAFVGSGQPISGVVNMANMLKGSFSVAYNLSNAADGIEYQYLDRDRNWETQTLRVTAPGVTTMLNPARITGDGVTTEAHAAVLARYHLAQSLYQYKTIDFGADIEHLDYRRLSLLSVSHDLTQWGFGGRVVSADTVAGKVVLTLDEEVPALPTRYIGLRVPGARDYRVFGVEAFSDKQNTVTLVGDWPAGVAFPGGTLENPAHDTLWCYDFKATPGYRVRVVGIEPEADLKGARVSCVPEGPEFWDYVLNGTYVPAPAQSSLPELARPSVSNLRISEEVHLQGDTEWYELHAVWDAAGEYDHAQVWAGLDGSELRMVDGNAVSTRASFRIEAAGEWLIEVRPFNTSGMVGQSAAALYITSRTNIPPRNVDQFVVQVVEGGLRRFAWQYTGDKPPAFAGVQIRYLSGDVPVSEAGWDAMTPLGKPDDVYTAQFESTRPAAGTWTFGVRAIDTAGQLSPGVLRFAIALPTSLPGTTAPDLTPPPKPTGVTATALMSTAQVDWNAPTYTVGRGHDHSIISAAVVVMGQPLPEFSAASVVGSPEGHPASIPVELGGIQYRLWVQHVSKEGIASPPSDPVEITTSVDPGKILEILTGQITESQLNASLSTPISTIPTLAANIAAEASTRATQTGELYAQYTVKVDVNGYVAGYGLASTLVNGTPTSEFVIRADNFAIAPVATDNNANDGSPFFYRTTPTVINGVTIPAGGYMKSAYIHDASITNAKIANLAVDDAKIANLSVSKLTAGSLAVGQYVQSTNYVANTSGWRINADGTAELGVASIRGQLTAAQIDTRGLTIKDAGGTVIFGSGTGLDWSQITGANRPANGATVGATADEQRKIAEVYFEGANMAPNSAFMSLDGWIPYNNAGIPVTSWLNPNGALGNAGYCIQADAGGASTLGIYTNSSFPGGGVKGYAAGQGYYISCYVAAHGPGMVGKTISLLNSNNLWGSVSMIENPPLVDGVFQRYVGYAVAQAGSDLNGGSLWISYAGSSPAAGSAMTISCVQVERALQGGATRWNAALRDSPRAGNPITSANASTYIANLAVTHLQLAGGAASVHNVLGFSGGTGTLATGTIGMPANGVLEFVGGYRLSPPAEFYSASQRAAFRCNITVVVYKNGAHIGSIAAYGSVVNGPWVGFNQQYGSSVGDFTGKILGMINVEATISDVFSFRVDCSSNIILSGSSYNAGYCFEGVLHVSGVYK